MAARTAGTSLSSLAVLLALGFLPTALVSTYYEALPRRFVVQWDAFGNTTIIGTRPWAVLMLANAAAVVALSAAAVLMWQRSSLASLGLTRAYLTLNIAQVAAINLTCAMIVSDALGLALKIKPAIGPAQGAALFAMGMLCTRIPNKPVLRGVGLALAAAGVLLTAGGAIAVNAAVGYYAAAFAGLSMAALLTQDRVRPT